MASICFSVVLPLCDIYICHSCIMNGEISVKNFSGTAQLRKVTFSTNIWNDKLYCLRNNQASPAYQSLYLSIFMPPTLKKLEGHIAFGLSVCVCVCVYTFVNF